MNNIQKIKKENPKTIGTIFTNLFWKNVPKSIVKSLFCGLCNQVVFIRSTTCHALFENFCEKGIIGKRKTDCFWKLSDFYVKKNDPKGTEDHYEES